MNNVDTEIKIEEALDYLNNNPQKSLELFDSILEYNSDNIKALNGKGSALVKLKKFDEAEKLFNESLQIKQTSSALLNMGLISKNKKDYNQALDYYNQAFEIDNNLVNIIQTLKNEVNELIGITKRQNILNEYRVDVKSLIEEGINYKKSEKYWEALDSYELAIKKEPSCQYLVKQYIEEIKIILQREFLFKQLHIDNSEINQLKIQSIKDLIRENNQINALININKALEINPNDLEALNIKSCILFYFEDYEGSIYCLDKCIYINPNYVYALFNKCIVLRRMKRLSDTIKCFNEIKNINNSPINVEIYKEELLEKLLILLDISIDSII